ncbi:MAG: alkaline phosphatase family protein, partial [Bacteroidaceae bacterium]
KEREANYTVVVSLDGLRWDYPLLYAMPQLDAIARDGVSARMKPCYPASTYPNHYSIATGLYPDHHGIVSNTFWDKKTDTLFSYMDTLTRNNPAYYGGEPIWNTAERQGLKTATLYWVGGGLNTPDSLKAYHLKWISKKRMKMDARVDYALKLLAKPERERPRLLMLYMEQPDVAGHQYGPHHEVTGAVTHYCDSMVGKLRAGIKKLPFAKNVNLIILSDHGMTKVSGARRIYLDEYVPARWIERSVGHSPTFIYAKPHCADSIETALRAAPHLHVWRRNHLPISLHYGMNSRVGNIVVAPDLGWLFIDTYRKRDAKGALCSSKEQDYKTKGEHGYYPWNTDMQVPFCACGPDFKKGYRSAGFLNIDVYSLLAYLLNIEPAQTDGNFERVADMIKEEETGQ